MFWWRQGFQQSLNERMATMIVSVSVSATACLSLWRGLDFLNFSRFGRGND
jgi:hypothetical protein